ncbi:hypothetical protein SLOPH_2482 [Spraguea lophii 42_110]|uniref:Uncharacterized protein n=1 Tax=Spraguea lophii (strain 42_110) TaxID=1358809 RepID=S7XGZ8_SPRLO|nr:hypothetical protein SLOPH_2482 [Spraguea lophii 42_110]
MKYLRDCYYMIMIFFLLAMLLFQKTFQTEILENPQSSSSLKTEDKPIRKNSIEEQKVFYQNDNQEGGECSNPLKNMDKVEPVEVQEDDKLLLIEIPHPGSKFVKILSSLSCNCIDFDERDPSDEEVLYYFKSETEEDDNRLYEAQECIESSDTSALVIKDDETKN